MGSPRRIYTPEGIYRVRNTCACSLPLFQNISTAEIHGFLLHAAVKHEIEIISMVFMPSYFELLIRSKAMAIDAFMRDFQAPMAKLLKQNWDGVAIEAVFPVRYQAPLVAEDFWVNAFLDMLCLPCVEGFVEHPSAWPAASGWGAMMAGEPLQGRWVDRSLFWKLRQQKAYSHLSDEELIELVTEDYALELTKLPAWRDLDDEAYREKVGEGVDARTAQLSAFRDGPCPPPDSEAWGECVAEHCGQRPARIGLVNTASSLVLREFYQARKKANRRYDEAADRLRRGLDEAYFPVGMFPPGHRFCVGSAGAKGAGEQRGAPEAALSDTG